MLKRLESEEKPSKTQCKSFTDLFAEWKTESFLLNHMGVTESLKMCQRTQQGEVFQTHAWDSCYANCHLHVPQQARPSAWKFVPLPVVMFTFLCTVVWAAAKRTLMSSRATLSQRTLGVLSSIAALQSTMCTEKATATSKWCRISPWCRCKCNTCRCNMASGPETARTLSLSLSMVNRAPCTCIPIICSQEWLSMRMGTWHRLLGAWCMAWCTCTLVLSISFRPTCMVLAPFIIRHVSAAALRVCSAILQPWCPKIAPKNKQPKKKVDAAYIYISWRMFGKCLCDTKRKRDTKGKYYACTTSNELRKYMSYISFSSLESQLCVRMWCAVYRNAHNAHFW